jgi:hypothetical protein
MIQNLVTAIAARLQQNFDGVQVLTTSPQTLPITLPAIAVYLGAFRALQALKNLPAEPQRKDIQQTLTKTDKLPHALDYVAIPDSVQAALLKDGSPPEALLAGKDFKVDYEKSTLSLPTNKVAVNDQVLVDYTCIQTTTEREFEQEFSIDVYDTSPESAEKWASLTCAVVLGSLDELLDTFNHQSAPYREKLFTTRHELRKIELLEGAPIPDETVSAYKLKFNTSGELHMVRQLAESPSVIKEVIINQKFG